MPVEAVDLDGASLNADLWLIIVKRGPELTQVLTNLGLGEPGMNTVGGA